MLYSRYLVQAHIFLENIVGNFRLLTAAARSGAGVCAPLLLPDAGGGESSFIWPELVPVVKADAYGHGHIEVARSLAGAGARAFASGCAGEAAALRSGLEESAGASRPPILALLGILSREDMELCAAHGIIPLLSDFAQLRMLENFRFGAGLAAVAIKFNTGMSRLGFNEEELPALCAALRSLPGLRPVLALSHLHSADTEGGREAARAQAVVFARMLQSLRAEYPDIAASLANSAGTFFASDLTEIIGPHVCRPGLALYGGNPFYGTARESSGAGTAPAMAVSAPLLAERTLPEGAGLGYGHTFRAGRAMRVGIIAAGYADGFSRGLSNRGEVCIAGARAPVIGRVSMQMSAVDLSALPRGLEKPERAWIMGGPWARSVKAEELAAAWGSIAYEVMCTLGRNERVYV
ncbi:MAG: alanine racemase [Desulfovibrio sp.]|nr:alanine racemase [Desulfovibrio sp.]